MRAGSTKSGGLTESAANAIAFTEKNTRLMNRLTVWAVIAGCSATLFLLLETFFYSNFYLDKHPYLGLLGVAATISGGGAFLLGLIDCIMILSDGIMKRSNIARLVILLVTAFVLSQICLLAFHTAKSKREKAEVGGEEDAGTEFTLQLSDEMLYHLFK